jgi:hypothetical protein
LKRFLSVMISLVLVALAMDGASAAVWPQPYGNPTPCYPSFKSAEVDLNNQGESDSSASPDGDTNEAVIGLTANASGFLPNCYYSYSLSFDTYNVVGFRFSGQFSIRVWVCGRYQGDFGVPFSGAQADSYTTPGSWYYGSCGKQADNLYFHLYNSQSDLLINSTTQPGYLHY